MSLFLCTGVLQSFSLLSAGAAQGKQNCRLSSAPTNALPVTTVTMTTQAVVRNGTENGRMQLDWMTVMM